MSARMRQWIYANPMVAGMLSPAQFELRETEVPALQPGQALVRVKLINVHAATRHRMATGMTALGDTDRSNYACGEVVRSLDPAFREGDIVACQAGWQEFQVISSSDVSVGYGEPSELVKALNRTRSQWCYAFRPEMARMWPSHVLMDLFGTSGMTAYFGMRECGPLMPRDVVAVAGVTGSVGSIVAQLARAAGCRVVGFAGGPAACDWALQTLDLDHCIDYRAADFADRLVDGFPDGIDVFSDGVGGAFTEAVAAHLNRYGRLFSFGSAAAFYADELDITPKPGRTLRRAFGISDAVEALLRQRRIKSQCWIVHDFYHERLRAEDDLSRLLRSGALKAVNRVVDGFDQLPAAISALYQTPRTGKLQIRFVPD